ncbi:MAG: hypothetical protein V9G19_05355 [Tetrasphaera sp.]
MASAAGVECRVRGDDPAFPGVHADDLDRCREINGFDHALRLVPDGELLEVRPVR